MVKPKRVFSRAPRVSVVMCSEQAHFHSAANILKLRALCWKWNTSLSLLNYLKLNFVLFFKFKDFFAACLYPPVTQSHHQLQRNFKMFAKRRAWALHITFCLCDVCDGKQNIIVTKRILKLSNSCHKKLANVPPGQASLFASAAHKLC